jgi:hypothetical protein
MWFECCNILTKSVNWKVVKFRVDCDRSKVRSMFTCSDYCIVQVRMNNIQQWHWQLLIFCFCMAIHKKFSVCIILTLCVFLCLYYIKKMYIFLHITCISQPIWCDNYHVSDKQFWTTKKCQILLYIYIYKTEWETYGTMGQTKQFGTENCVWKRSSN